MSNIYGSYSRANKATGDAVIDTTNARRGQLISTTNVYAMLKTVALGRAEVIGSCLESQAEDTNKTTEDMALLNEDMNAIRQRMVNQKSDSEDYKQNQADLQKLQGKMDALNNFSQRQMLTLKAHTDRYDEAVNMCGEYEKSHHQLNQKLTQ